MDTNLREDVVRLRGVRVDVILIFNEDEGGHEGSSVAEARAKCKVAELSLAAALAGFMSSQLQEGGSLGDNLTRDLG